MHALSSLGFEDTQEYSGLYYSRNKDSLRNEKVGNFTRKLTTLRTTKTRSITIYLYLYTPSIVSCRIAARLTCAEMLMEIKCFPIERYQDDEPCINLSLRRYRICLSSAIKKERYQWRVNNMIDVWKWRYGEAYLVELDWGMHTPIVA